MSAGINAERTGRCLCGAVRFRAMPTEQQFGVCHCSMCRRWTAGPMFAVECGGNVHVEDEASLGVYRSSDWAERCFCKVCGTSLFYRFVENNYYAISAEALDDTSGLRFATEIFIDEKPDSYTFANSTKKMTGADVMAAFAPKPE